MDIKLDQVRCMFVKVIYVMIHSCWWTVHGRRGLVRVLQMGLHSLLSSDATPA